MSRRVVVGSVALALLTAGGGVGCSWSRFNDLSDETPVVALSKVEKMSGFGVSLATARNEERSLLFVGGAPGRSSGAAFELGQAASPMLDAVDTGHCLERDTICSLGATAAGLGRALVPGGRLEPLCFASGIGQSNLQVPGLLFRCASNLEYALDVPPSVLSGFILPTLRKDERGIVSLASDKDEAPAVIAGAPVIAKAWYYWSESLDPVELVPASPRVDASFGATVASVRLGGGARVFAVAAPEQGHLWLFRSTDGQTVQRLGCLASAPGFGKALASGPVQGAGVDDLVVSDSGVVTVLSGAVLGALPETNGADCSFGALPAGGVIASFTCGQTPDIEGCSSSRFGEALAVGDLDGDGDGEVAVGAPAMKVRGVTRAGAVLVYDAEGSQPERLSEVRFISSAEEDDQLGASVAMPQVGERSIVAAGAPGNGKTLLFYCSSLSPEAKDSARCK